MKKLKKEQVYQAIIIILFIVLTVGLYACCRTTIRNTWSIGKNTTLGETLTAGSRIEQTFESNYDITELGIMVEPSEEHVGTQVQLQVIDNTEDMVVYDEILSTSGVTMRKLWEIPMETEGVNPDQGEEPDSFTLILTGIDGTEENCISPVVVWGKKVKYDMWVNGTAEDGRLVLSIENDTVFNWGYFLGGSMLLVAAYLILYLRKIRTWKLEQYFVILALVAGTLMVSLMPPVQAPDELYHFKKSVDVSYGNLSPFILTTNDSIYELTGPEDIVDLEKKPIYANTQKAIKEKEKFRGLSMDSRVKTVDSEDGFHPFIGYIPQAVGVLLGRIFHFNGLYTLYLARFLNLLTYIALNYLAIKLMPFGKHILMVLAATPICIAQAASVSSDGICNGTAFLLVALILYYTFSHKGELGMKHMLKIAGLILVLAFVKYVYAILALLVFLIPQEKFGTKKKYWTTFFMIVIPMAVIFLIYYSFVANYIAGQVSAKEGVNALEQMKFSLYNPKKLISAYIVTFEIMPMGYLDQFNTLGSLNFRLGVLVYIVPLFLLYTTVTDTQDEGELRLGQKLLLGGTGVLIVLVVMYSMYLVWTPVGSGIIDGVQARYFIPALPLILLFIRSRRIRVNIEGYTRKVAFVAAVCLWMMVFYMMRLCY